MLTRVLVSSWIGSISIKAIINLQSSSLWPGKGTPFWDFVFQGFTPWAWFFLVQPLMIVIYYVCGLAETNRAPFDLPDAESELVSGYLPHYSPIPLPMFALPQYRHLSFLS